MKKIMYPEECESNIDDLLDRIPKENKYIVTTADLINYCYSLENRIDKAIEYIENNCQDYYTDIPHYRGYQLIEVEDLLNILRGEDNG